MRHDKKTMNIQVAWLLSAKSPDPPDQWSCTLLLPHGWNSHMSVRGCYVLL